MTSSIPAFAAVNDFYIQNYKIDYYLDRDNAGRSTLKTVEAIAAVFPTTDQNHGIERAIPNTYDGHPINLAITSVTDETNTTREYSTRSSNNNTVLRIGSASSYVHGMQTYKITYTQRDVTKYFKDINDDEFYWDTNGTQWAVPINALQVRLHIADALKDKLTARQECYAGQAGSSSSCQITTEGDGFVASANGLQANENMTLAIGFQPKTFTSYKMSSRDFLFSVVVPALQLLTLGLAVLAIIWIIVRYQRRSERTAEIGTIIPEYLPPADTSVTASGRIIGKSSFSAQLIDFAVRHYIKIYQTREKSLLRAANYEIEIIRDITDLKPEEQEILRDLYGDPYVGARLDMATLKNNRTVSRKLVDNQGKLMKDITGQYGLRARNSVESAWFKRLGIILLLLAIVTLSPWLLIASIIAFVCRTTLKPLTDQGLQLARYLKGLEMYIKTAETDRLRMLQSPNGAEKLGAPIDTNDARQLIKLYERVLPYAISFGQEKEWNNRLGHYYETLNESPIWYAGHNNAAFNAVALSSAMSSFNTAASYSDPSSSSSGGSSGGGSSGGGGGGGGGGGW